ncbi:NIPSNAP family protein [Pelagerythrobacter sp.]|uniref:NIPSNAP family protein n=1 Tax=Pelagerythrobacter sp. TaxID=2800702 RepID=UPI0035AF96D0
MLQELRLYEVVAGRTPDIAARFEKLPALFSRHGIACRGHWHSLAGGNATTFVYLMEYADFAERDDRWGGFYVDADWHRLRAETNAGEEMVDRIDTLFLRPHRLATVPGEAAPGLSELLVLKVSVGQQAVADEFLEQFYLPRIAAAGGTVDMLSNVVSGCEMPAIAMKIGWPDAASWMDGRLALERSDELNSAIARQRREIGVPALAKAKSWLLHAPNAAS